MILLDTNVVSEPLKPAADAYAVIRARARTAGKAIGAAEGYIAAIAAAHGFAVASRDSTPFEAAGVPVVNPWQQGPC
jgi:hypothetical protein